MQLRPVSPNKKTHNIIHRISDTNQKLKRINYHRKVVKYLSKIFYGKKY